MTSYNPQDFEKKWQDYWDKIGAYRADDFSIKPKKYILVEFPYLSGDGLHVGHVRSYSALDAVARKKRMEGFNVLYPIGWDAFGLPAENYALKEGIQPQTATETNISTFKRQIKSLGLSFDWSREINTTDPQYYRWTQWIFLKLFKRGLAYQAKIPINWCPACKIGLANEEVVAGDCERCGAKTEKREIKQWLLRITKYAERLLNDLAGVDYSPRIKTQQVNWIGRSEGATIFFPLDFGEGKIEVFTTRPDTVFGVTALVLAPEHPLAKEIPKPDKLKAVQDYISQSQKKSDFERTELVKEKTGVFTGSYALNPASDERVPIWVGDYVVATYGGGAVMVVPAHDERDYCFAKKYGLEIREVVSGGDIENAAYTGEGVLVNSGQFNGLNSRGARGQIASWLSEKKLGETSVSYKLRDWVFSRQHYWGEPIPIIHCEKCGAVPVPEDQLPVELPYVEKYQPSGTGESPLAVIESWVKTSCPKCQGPASRETDTMPNWAGSSWYFLRYVDPANDQAFAAKDKVQYWLPVDLYNGGMEHTTLHLLYSRFWHKFLYDLGLVNSCEPYAKRRSHGVVLALDGRKMSKSFGNAINPDEIVKAFGADTLRLYEMFMGPFDQMISWDSRGVEGVSRFLKRVWRLFSERSFKLEKESSLKMRKALHSLIKKVGDDIEALHFNTAVAALMEFTNMLSANEFLGKEEASAFLRVIAPLAPHLAEELYSKIFLDFYTRDPQFTIHLQEWPRYDSQLLEQAQVTVLIQVNGKLRGKLEMSPKESINKEVVSKLSLGVKKVAESIGERSFKQVVFVSGKIINFVV